MTQQLILTNKQPCSVHLTRSVRRGRLRSSRITGDQVLELYMEGYAVNQELANNFRIADKQRVRLASARSGLF
jgi:hypothetical protein